MTVGIRDPFGKLGKCHKKPAAEEKAADSGPQKSGLPGDASLKRVFDWGVA